jgi:ABC-2 type transport system permease protein
MDTRGHYYRLRDTRYRELHRHLYRQFHPSPADVLLYATAILFPLIYLSGFFRNQHPTGILQTLRGFVPFSYTDDAMKTVFGHTTATPPLEILIYPTVICAVLAFVVCLTAPRLLSQRP